jgi:hypothetical protein
MNICIILSAIVNIFFIFFTETFNDLRYLEGHKAFIFVMSNLGMPALFSLSYNYVINVACYWIFVKPWEIYDETDNSMFI